MNSIHAIKEIKCGGFSNVYFSNIKPHPTEKGKIIVYMSDIFSNVKIAICNGFDINNGQYIIRHPLNLITKEEYYKLTDENLFE
jgi:hypothetical protein